jgi:hypothetical protein
MKLFDWKSLLENYYLAWQDVFFNILLRLHFWFRLNGKDLLRICLAIRIANQLLFDKFDWEAFLDEVTVALFLN